MEIARYIIPYVFLFNAILINKGIKLRKLGDATPEGMIGFALFLLILGVSLEYLLYDTKNATFQTKMKIVSVLFCKLVSLVSLGYLILYWGDVYSNDIYFSLSILLISCGGTTKIAKLKKKKEYEDS